MRPAPVWTSASGAVGATFGGDRNFGYAKLTIPVALGDNWTLGPTAAAYCQMKRGETRHGNERNDDRAAVGLELRRALGAVNVSGEEARPSGDDSIERVAFYLGARGLYSYSQGDGEGFAGGLVGGTQYVPTRGFAIGLEASVLRVPGEFLFAPLGTLTFNL